MLFSRSFRQWLRENRDPWLIQEDKGKSWENDGLACRWPVYDQSLVIYWVTLLPFSLERFDESFIFGPHFLHYGGQKTEENVEGFFRKYRQLEAAWERSKRGPEGGWLRPLELALLRRRLYPRRLVQPPLSKLKKRWAAR